MVKKHKTVEDNNVSEMVVKRQTGVFSKTGLQLVQLSAEQFLLDSQKYASCSGPCKQTAHVRECGVFSCWLLVCALIFLSDFHFKSSS